MDIDTCKKNLLTSALIVLAVLMVTGAWASVDVPPPAESAPALEELGLLDDDPASAIAPAPSSTIAKESKKIAASIDYSKMPCMSIGSPNRGRLINGKPLPRNDAWINRSPERQSATPELIEGLTRSVEAFRKEYPNSCRIITGDISHTKGGPMLPHVSHQSGRDIDLSMFAKNNREMTHFEMMNAGNLDVPKTWSLIQALLDNAAIEYVLVDYNLQELLYHHVRFELSATEDYLDRVFQYPRPPSDRVGIVRHSRGHRNHFHIRFFTPKAVAAAGKYTHLDPVLAQFHRPDVTAAPNVVKYFPLIRRKNLEGHTLFVADKGLEGQIEMFYTVAAGDNLWSIAQKFGTTLANLYRYNDLSKSPILQTGAKIRLFIDSPDETPSDDFLGTTKLLAKYGKSKKIHVAQAGETLWSIADAYQIKIATLCQANDLTIKNELTEGQEIIVPIFRPIYAIAGPLTVTPKMIADNSHRFTPLRQRLTSAWKGFSWVTVKNFLKMCIYL